MGRFVCTDHAMVTARPYSQRYLLSKKYTWQRTMTPAQFHAKAEDDMKRFGAIIRERKISGD